MARVRLNETGDLPEDYRWIFERMEKRGGLLNIFRALSHSPEAMRRFMKFGSYLLDEGKLDPKLRELAILKAGQVCRSPYEFSQHIAFARRVGLSDSQVRGLRTRTWRSLIRRNWPYWRTLASSRPNRGWLMRRTTPSRSSSTPKRSSN